VKLHKAKQEKQIK